jgi:hypothetical protein|uniref:Uncharacterized protein n=1 Tax=Myoviridae sp. ctkfK18 TaxID=2825165 RepID=A0A8S5VGX2_9CAUD|nr:MAG TPA: hypothetical protein [Myoviridae sp. ctkfK18]
MTSLDLAITNCYYNLLKVKSINEKYISSLPKAAQANARDKFINNLSNSYNDILNNGYRSDFDKSIAKYALDQIKYWN